MAWQRVALVVAGSEAFALADAFEAAGALSTDIADADAGTPREDAVFDEPGAGPGADPSRWARARVSALFPEGADASRAAGEALSAAGVSALAGASLERLEDADWVARTQAQFAPIRAGERLWIVPSWHAAPDPGAVNVALDPGAAFGTGSHPTTRMVLAWLERRVRPGDTVLDYGCGSGILAIAALKLGAASATGVDIDPLALEAARYNARRNGVGLALAFAGEPIAHAASITVANILANPLRMLAPLLASHTAAGGSIALSGVLPGQAAEVAAAYAPWFEIGVEREEEGWALLVGTRRA